MVQKPDKFPHWMEKADKPSYKSETVLGQLYDQVVQHPVAQEVMHYYAVVDANAVGHQWLLDDPAVPCWPKQLLQVRQNVCFACLNHCHQMSIITTNHWSYICTIHAVDDHICIPQHWSVVGFLSVVTFEGS
jgi:hypothetical protein